jgi:hypothetical protein
VIAAILSIFIGLAAPADAAPKKLHETVKLNQEVADLSGVYLVEGLESEKRYDGVCILRAVSSDVYMYHNVVGQLVTKGIALRTGDNLAVSFTAGESCGVSLFRISGFTLSGRWSANGNVHRETLRLVSRFEAGE